MHVNPLRPEHVAPPTSISQRLLSVGTSSTDLQLKSAGQLRAFINDFVKSRATVLISRPIRLTYCVLVRFARYRLPVRDLYCMHVRWTCPCVWTTETRALNQPALGRELNVQATDAGGVWQGWKSTARAHAASHVPG